MLKILVTGGAGFIGSAVVKLALQKIIESILTLNLRLQLKKSRRCAK